MIIMRRSNKIQQGIWCSRLKQYFSVRLTIIEVRPGETREDSWKRHATEHPEAQFANIKIFNRTDYDQAPQNSGNGHTS